MSNARKSDHTSVKDNRYHDTNMLLKRYRDVVWSLELSVCQVKRQFRQEYACSLEDFLDTVYMAGAELHGTDIESHTRCIERTRKMIRLLEDAVELLRTRHKKGEAYYWVLYYAYLSPKKPKNAEEIMAALQPHIRDISPSTYYRLRREAVEAVSSVLWGYTARDTLDVLDHILPGKL